MSSFATDCRRSGSRRSLAPRRSTRSVIPPPFHRSRFIVLRPITSTRRFDILHYTPAARRRAPFRATASPPDRSQDGAADCDREEPGTTVTVQLAFAESLRAAKAAGTVGARRCSPVRLYAAGVLPMRKKAWAAKFKDSRWRQRNEESCLAFARRAPRWSSTPTALRAR